MRIGAGGWVTGMSMSNDGTTRLVRTDTYGAYNWNPAAGEWALATTTSSLPASEWGPRAEDGVLAVAVAPTRASRAYMAFNNALFRSDDGARTWTKVLADVPTEPNDRWRYWGSRLEVDPLNPDVVYYGTQTQGLLWSRDAGATWTRVGADALAAPSQSPGINAVAVDPYSAPVAGRSSVVYAASYGNGIYRSADGGTSWSRISDASVVVGRNLRVAPNRDLLATTHPSTEKVESISGNVHRWRSGTWTNIEPAGERWWHSIAVDAAQPGRVALMGDGGYLFMSNDYGDTWTHLSERSMDSSTDVPWLAWAVDYGKAYKWLSIGEIKFDPVRPGRLWLTEGVGVWYADLAPGTAVRWLSQSRGIEQLVPTDVISAPGQAPVVSAWDRPILRSADPNTYPATYGPSKDFSGGWDLDWSITDPNFMVASVASPMWPHNPAQSGYSTDGGQTWTPFATLPRASTNAAATFGFGNMAVSTPDNIVWAPSYGKRPAYTKDRGRTWQDLTLPGVTDYQSINNTALYMSRRIVTADRVRPGTFYLFMLGQGVFRTTDGGDTWARVSDFSPFVGGFYDYHVTLTAVPGREGHLFLTPGRLDGITTVPLRRSTDGGATWTNVANVTGVSAVGFGKAFSGGYPSIYIAGHLNGAYGIYRSDDDGATWTRLGVHPGGKTGHIRTIEGDKNVAGRFYLGIHGGGWMRGTGSR
jgi:photosystem II stability/assembly factor-like uncharacterized protein